MLNSDFNGLFSSFSPIKIQCPLSIPAQVAHALDVLAVDVDFVKGMVAKIGQALRCRTDGP